MFALCGCGDDVSVVGGGGQGGSPPTDGCTADPFACVAGTTCWVLSNQSSFDCLPSGAGVADEACVNTAGQATCGDGLVCLQLEGAMSGFCTPYCTPANPCVSEAVCLTITLAGSTFQACEPQGQGGASQGGASQGGAGQGGAG